VVVTAALLLRLESLGKSVFICPDKKGIVLKAGTGGVTAGIITFV
jgi:hypothetical protein